MPALLRTAAAILVLVVPSAACGGPAGPGGVAPVTLQLATASRSAAGTPLQFANGADELIVSSVQVVARKLRLGVAAGSCPADEGSSEEGAGSEECPMLKAGPLLLEPPVTEGATSAFTADLPAGTYDRLRFQIHKPAGSADQAFLLENPGFDGVSIRVQGTYNGSEFSFTTPLTIVEEIPLEAPLEVVEGTPTDVTLLLEVAAWFVDQTGSLLDPSTPTQQARSRIEQNIRRSFKAFRDRNADGVED